jgi:hypothetical protein
LWLPRFVEQVLGFIHLGPATLSLCQPLIQEALLHLLALPLAASYLTTCEAVAPAISPIPPESTGTCSELAVRLLV